MVYANWSTARQAQTHHRLTNETAVLPVGLDALRPTTTPDADHGGGERGDQQRRDDDDQKRRPDVQHRSPDAEITSTLPLREQLLVTLSAFQHGPTTAQLTGRRSA
jgi:hypothetical protein